MGRDRRAMGAPLEVRPSGVARDRLAGRLRRDVADVRVRLEEAALRSDALLATGQPERAAEVLDEQQALLVELRDTVSSTVVAALVEAEAESVLVASPDGPSLFAAPRLPAPVRGPRRRIRSTASALVSAAAALALLIVAAPIPSPDTRPAVDRADRVDATGVGAPADRAHPGAPDADPRAIAAHQLGVRGLPASPAPAAPGGAADHVIRFSLFHFQALVDQFVATVVRAAGGLAPATLSVVADHVAPIPPADRPLRDAAVAIRPADRAEADEVDGDDPAPAEAGPAAEPTEPEASSEPDLELPPEDGHAPVPGVAELE